MKSLQQHIDEKLLINKNFTEKNGPVDFDKETDYMLIRFNSYFCTCIISPFDMDKFTYNGRRWCGVVGHLTSKFKDKYDVDAEYNENCIYFFDSSQYQPYERFNVLIPISRLSRNMFDGIRNYKTLLFSEFSAKLGMGIDEIPSENFKKNAGYKIHSKSTHFLSAFNENAVNEKLIINKNFNNVNTVDDNINRVFGSIEKTAYSISGFRGNVMDMMKGICTLICSTYKIPWSEQQNRCDFFKRHINKNFNTQLIDDANNACKFCWWAITFNDVELTSKEYNIMRHLDECEHISYDELHIPVDDDGTILEGIETEKFITFILFSTRGEDVHGFLICKK